MLQFTVLQFVENNASLEDTCILDDPRINTNTCAVALNSTDDIVMVPLTKYSMYTFQHNFDFLFLQNRK